MAREKTLKLVLKIGVLGAFLVGLSILIVAFFNFLRAGDAASYEILLAAFSGAFASFLFIRLGEFLAKLHQRRQRNLTALVILQHRLNYLLVQADDNAWLAGHFLEHVSPSLRPGEAIRASSDRLTKFRVEEDLLVDLTNLDLINEMFGLNISLLKLNDSIDTVERLYYRTLEAVRASELDESSAATYNSNIGRVIRDMYTIRAHFFDLIEDVKGLSAKVRVLGQEQTVFGWVLRKVTITRYPSGFDSKVSDELRCLEEEMETSSRRSQEKIDSIRKRQTEL